MAPICDESLLTSLTHIDDTCLLLKNCWTRRVLCGEYYVQPVLSKSDHRFWQPRRSCFGLSVRRQPLSVNHLDTMLDTNDASKMCALLDKPSLSCTQKAVPETLVWLCVGRTLSPKKQGVCYFFFPCVTRKEQLVHLHCFASYSTTKTKSGSMRE